MKTKNIFNLLALAMLMPAMLLTTACSNEDDVVNNTENIANKGYELPVTVNVTRQDAAATRATFDGSKLNFSTGDKLFVKGNDYSAGGAGFFAGTLTWQSGGTFSGTILTENAYSGTIDALFKASSTLATLLPANYGNYPYLFFEDEGTYSASINYDATKTFATSKATAVEQFSFEVGGYKSGTGFALHPANAILNFTITGLAANTGVDVALSEEGVDFTISGNVTTDDLGTATFAIGVYGETDLKDWTLKVGVKSITLVSSSKVLAAGKIYNINRSEFTMAADATSADKGKLICTDGHIHANGADNGCTKARVALITYVGDGGSADSNGSYRGLALALKDADSGKFQWGTESNSGCTHNNYPSGAEYDKWGIDNTDKQVSDGHVHPAATAARNYKYGDSASPGAHPTGTSAWFLPSAGQWNLMITAAGSYDALRTSFSSVNGDNLKLGTGDDCYWSSTQESSEKAWFYNNNAWQATFKVNWLYVRACLAF